MRATTARPSWDELYRRRTKAIPKRLSVTRAVKIALHEIGHTFGLDHHSYEDGVDCLMIGDAEVDSVETVDSRGGRFCADCAAVVARRLALRRTSSTRR